MPKTILLPSFALCCLTVLASGCFIPPMANMQSARTVEESQVRITPFYSAVEEKDGGSEKVADEFGLLFGVGLGGKSEFQFRYDRFVFPEDDDGYNFTSLGIKVGAVKDILAFTIPLGFYWGSDVSIVDTFEFDPGVIATLPLGKSVELSGAGRLILPIDPDLVQRVILNGSVCLSTDVSRWALVPEVGYTVAIDDSKMDPLFSYGIGLVYFTPLTD